jgi:hypothetical protein
MKSQLLLVSLMAVTLTGCITMPPMDDVPDLLDSIQSLRDNAVLLQGDIEAYQAAQSIGDRQAQVRHALQAIVRLRTMQHALQDARSSLKL